MAAFAITLTTSSSGYTGLHEACAAQNVSLVKEYAELLIHNGNQAESLHFLLGRDGRGMSAMDIVASSTSTEGRTILQLLQQTLAQLRSSLTASSSAERPPSPIPSWLDLHRQAPIVPKVPIQGEVAPPIFKALVERDLDALSGCLERGASPNAFFSGETPLTFAAKNDDCEAVKMLLGSSIISVNRVNEEGFTPYDIADSLGHKGIALLLQQHGGLPSSSLLPGIKKSPRLECLSELGQSMPSIHEAVASGNHRILKRLVEEEEDPNVFYRGQTPLMRAVVQRDLTSVAQLLESPYIQPAIQSPDGITALEMALLLENGEEFVALLISANDEYVAKREVPVSAPLQSSSSAGLSRMPPLFDALASNNNGLLVSRLMAGLNPNETYEGETPLTFAIKRSNLDAIKTLCLVYRADPNRINEKGQTPLQLATDAESIAIAALLVRKGADPELPNSEGLTPAALAASKELHLIQAVFAAASFLQELTEEEFWETVLANQI